MSRNVLFGIGGSLVVMALLAAIFALAGNKSAVKSAAAAAAESPPAGIAAAKSAAPSPQGAKGASKTPLRGGEAAIRAALAAPVSLEFKDTPLADVAEFMQTQLRIPIVLDKRAMEDAGIAPDVEVTCNLRGVSLRSALRLILRNLGLTYMIQDEVLLITTPEAAESRLMTIVYDVSDLVIPLRDHLYSGKMLPTTEPDASLPVLPFPIGSGMGMGGFGGAGMGGGMGDGMFDVAPEGSANRPASVAARPRVYAQRASSQVVAGLSGGGGGYAADFDSPINLITSTIQPTTWDSVGGPGSIAPFENTLSFVVSQTQEVHEEIADLLAQLRAARRGMPTVVVDADWLWLDREQYEKLVGGTKADGPAGLAVDPAVLHSLRRQATGFHGRILCAAGQSVFLASGDRRSAVVNAVPAGTNGAGCHPLVSAPNAGVLLKLCPVPDAATNSALLQVQNSVTRWGKPRPPAQIATSWDGAQRTETTVTTPPVPAPDAATPPVAGTPVPAATHRTDITQTPGGKASFPLDRPTMPAQEFGATVRVPLGKPVLLGAMTFAPEGGAGLDKPGDNPKQLCLIATTTLVPGQAPPAAKAK